jgi:hypothetical protein
MATPGRSASGLLKFSAQCGVIVDLSVKYNHPAAGVREHGLMASGRKINDRKAAVSECNSGLTIDPNPLVVWTSMRNGVGHAARDNLFALRMPGMCDEACNPTHLDDRFPSQHR